jgi:TolB-like protein
MKGSVVIAKMADTESTAKTRSTNSMRISASKSGVAHVVRGSLRTTAGTLIPHCHGCDRSSREVVGVCKSTELPTL